MPTINPFQVNGTCATCGQTDDHPKTFMLGVADGAQHLDCMTAEQRAQAVADNPAAAAAVAASAAGAQGDDLAAVLRSTIQPTWAPTPEETA